MSLTRHQKFAQLQRNYPSPATLGGEMKDLIRSRRVNQRNVKILQDRTNDTMKAWRSFRSQMSDQWQGTRDEAEMMRRVNEKMSNLDYIQKGVVNLWSSIGHTVIYR